MSGGPKLKFTIESDYRLTAPSALLAHDRTSGHLAMVVPPGSFDADTAEAVVAMLDRALSGLVVVD